MNDYIVWFDAVGMGDVERVGGKNASLGEMISQLTQMGVKVPNGFATTATAYRDFLHENDLNDKIRQALAALDVDDVATLAKTGSAIRQWVLDAQLPARLQHEITEAYQRLQDGAGSELSVAVRSSATAEDLPQASFAGQQETYLNVYGLEHVLHAVKQVFASLYNDRAIAYRVHQGFPHEKVALSAGIQRMVRSDIGASGVLFTMDTESGFRDVVFITASLWIGRDRGAGGSESR